jgi:hypothetical protein
MKPNKILIETMKNDDGEIKLEVNLLIYSRWLTLFLCLLFIWCARTLNNYDGMQNFPFHFISQIYLFFSWIVSQVENNNNNLRVASVCEKWIVTVIYPRMKFDTFYDKRTHKQKWI